MTRPSTAAVTTEQGLVVVGFDGSPTAETALAWGLDVAAHRGARVEVVQAWTWNVAGLGVVVPDAPVTVALSAKHSVETQLAKALADRGGAVQARARTVEGDAASVLLAEAPHADLLVLGRHGQSAWQRRLVGATLGSVAGACLSRATCPVAVVPPEAVGGTPARVVVGVDGSASSVRALRWGVGHAAAVGVPVLAVLAWQLTTLPAPPTAREDWSVPPITEWESLGRDLLADTVAQVEGPSEVQQLLLHRPAAAGLLETVQPEDLLVLGERGRGGFARLLLGSVSRQCVEYAPCPVVVVPPRDRSAT